jgi:nitrogen-specific signal transduction histidine kinase
MASGSGLGLSIARALARLMRGDVTLESAANPTMFVVDLPGEPVPDGARPFSRENAPRQPEHAGGT